MVTTLTLQGTSFDNKNDMNDLYAKALEKFDEMLRQENCQIINISSSDTKKGLISKTQIITVVWTGSSTKIKSNYSVYPERGFFGISSATFT